MKPFNAIAPIALLALVPVSAVAQDDAGQSYMGIDLTQQASTAPVPEQRTVGLEMRDMLDRGVELGCLEFTPPAQFAQSENDSEECAAYLRQLAAATNVEEPRDAPQFDPAYPLRSMPLVRLARLAQSGNKQAQLELGIRFEEGIGGVERNPSRALELYTLASRATPARYGMVVRQTEPGAGGGVSRGQRSPRIPGLPEARERRDALEARLGD